MSIRQRFTTLAVVLGVLAPPTPHAAEAEPMRLFDFSDPGRADSWRPVHDVVMGGVSSGRVSSRGDVARFEGLVSLENNGGFASFRVDERLPDLSAHDGLRLRVRGDGQVYKLSLRTDGAWDGVSWQAPFATVADQWTTIDLAFEHLVPTWHGRLVTKAEPFDPASIRQMGLVIADKQDGPFALELASVDAWRAVEDEWPQHGARLAARERTAGIAARLDEGLDVEALAESLEWSERLLVVSAPDDLDAHTSLQLGRLLARAPDLDGRELRVVQLLGDRGGRLAGRTLGQRDVKELRRLWVLPERWTMALVGKDGGVKARWSSPVDPDEIFALVDTMPMRQREVAQRRVP
jgi:NADH dehydrogenase [ubiquinone] 1 alpha subcomplex assembly factor 1